MSESSASSNERASGSAENDRAETSREEPPSLEQEILRELSTNLRGYLRRQLGALDRTGGEYGRLAERLASQTGEDLDRAWEEGKEYVRAHPLRAVGGAFAAGLVLGWVTKRRK